MREDVSKNKPQNDSLANGQAGPKVDLPKGGGAIKGLGEKFAANPVTGSGGMTVPIPVSPGRTGFGPQLSISYDSSSGNGPFGLGWTLSLSSISRKTEKGVPRYLDHEESDVFLLSGAEDLVPYLEEDGIRFVDHTTDPNYTIHRYHPRIEGRFSRIERWSKVGDPSDIHWRTISPENVLTIFGKDSKSRIFDPLDDRKIFCWLVSEGRDDKGNVVLYDYKSEDGEGVDLSLASEQNRGDKESQLRTSNRYLKSVRYGNAVPLLNEDGLRPTFLEQDLLESTHWLFQVVFDYGEHDPSIPKPADTGVWDFRQDPFSTYRSGFEVRTSRLCQRALMFHHFPDEAGVGQDCLVHSLNFGYDFEDSSKTDAVQAYSYLTSVALVGYMREGDGYVSAARPALEFEYARPVVQDQIETAETALLENLPAGLSDLSYQWTDLYGEGVSGVLTEQGNGWYYTRNLSPVAEGAVEFAPQEFVAARPNHTIAQGAQLLDLDGRGQIDLVVFNQPNAGLYRLDSENNWGPYRPFKDGLNLNMSDPNLRFIDLDGDGLGDILISEDDAFVWYSYQGDGSFSEAARVRMSQDEEKGPRLVFSDGEFSIFLADMSGDGLSDLVRIRNGEICYWPNLGLGRFGAKVTMDSSPSFDHFDKFDRSLIRLTDIDGSGTTDIIYLHPEGVRLYFNLSGNGWSDQVLLKSFPKTNNLSHVVPIDILGNGTVCLVWSSPLAEDTGVPLRYIKLMGDQKPHLMTKSKNNLGAETMITYAPSTKFYLQDKRAGRPWMTSLPFPVHVVEKIETVDWVGRNRFTSSYSYHHGYFDRQEREFRGFAMVEKTDTEAFEDFLYGVERIEGGQELAPELNQPPITTRTWYHTGAFLNGKSYLHLMLQEYYLQKSYLPLYSFPEDIPTADLVEAVRALKGLPLRLETYSFDGSSEEDLPFQVLEKSFELTLVQGKGKQRHGVYLPIERETISLTFDRRADDPRITHGLNLEVNEYGIPVRGCQVTYGRMLTDSSLPAKVAEAQRSHYITYSEIDFNSDIDERSPVLSFRHRVPFRQKSYEITGIVPSGDLFLLKELEEAIATATSLRYEELPNLVLAEKRLLSESRSLFLSNHLVPMALGLWESLGLGYINYQLAFTPEVVSDYFAGKVSETDFESAGYVQLDDGNWWIPSGTALYGDNAKDHFYIPIGSKSALGVETIATFDKYDLLIERSVTTEASWNESSAVNDYRVLAPSLMIDANENRTAVAFDALGMVIKNAVMGKEGANEGDNIDDPTVKIEYDLFNWVNNGKPNYARTLMREKHGNANSRWIESYAYSNGSGSVIMVKGQTKPGKAYQVSEDEEAEEVDADPRWVGNARTVFNNKGRPVKQYEPYFSTTYEYENEKALVQMGVTRIYYYDALGRNYRTDFPNGTSTRFKFDPWMIESSDANDLVKESQWYADRGAPDPAVESEPVDDPERRAAWLSAKHSGTSGKSFFDSLGRTVYTIYDHGAGVTSATRSEMDLTGRYSTLYDQLERAVSSGFMAMSGMVIYTEHAEKGKRWSFQNIFGRLVKSWDQFGREFRVEYDVINRPVSTFVKKAPEEEEILFNYVVYGDRHPDPKSKNLLGQVYQTYDQAGVVRSTEFDFKGNTVSVERILANGYKDDLDWNSLKDASDLEELEARARVLLQDTDPFTVTTAYDALNRSTTVVLPDSSIVTPVYNLTSHLESLKVTIRGEGDPVEFLKDQDHDAKGQRLYSKHGNDLVTKYFYDPQTFRLTDLLTCRLEDEDGAMPLQKLKYTYDAVGNIVQVRDEAQATYYFNNDVVEAKSLFEYDGVYQLIKASGREHAGLTNDSIRTHAGLGYINQLPHENEANAVRNYTETYEYDVLGNIKKFKHGYRNSSGTISQWVRSYTYAYDVDATSRSNRLILNSLPGDPESGPYTATYTYDNYGNMTSMSHLTSMTWDFMDNLRKVNLGGGGYAYYVYDSGGQRIRKVIERNGGQRVDRIYLGGVEIYRESLGDEEPHLERWTLHVADEGRIAQVDIKTIDLHNSDLANPLNTPLIRYQYSNSLSSVKLETDTTGSVISYEEYHPFGTSAYRSNKPGHDLSLKRYRFAGKELDEETGLYYCGLRYYAPWLGRWTSPDPAGLVDGPNLYRYCRNSPIMYSDPSGTESEGFYVAGNPDEASERLWPESSAEDRAAFAKSKGYTLVEPHPEEAVWLGTRETGNWWLGDDATLTKDIVPTAEAPDGPPASGAAVEEPLPLTIEEAPEGSSGGANSSEGEASSRLKNVLTGVAVGLVVALAVVAVVATGGAALAVIAPGAAAAISGSSMVAAAGTAMAYAGGTLLVANTVQSLRQKDLWGNDISQEEADYNLGVGIGSAAAGALAKPFASGGAELGKDIGLGARRFGAAVSDEVAALGESLSNGGMIPVTVTGTTGGRAIAATGAEVAGVSTTSAVTIAGVSSGATVMAMAGHKADWDLHAPEGKLCTGAVKSGCDVPPGRRLTWNEQLGVHTERKILDRLKEIVRPGDKLSIRGTKDPCNPGGRGCSNAMREFAKEHGITIEYTNTTTGTIFRFP